MTHFLDTLPFDLSQRPAQELWAILADTYYRPGEVETLLRRARIRPASIDFSGSMDIVWADILTRSRAQNLLRPLLQAVVDSGDAAVAARIDELRGPEPPTSPPATTGPLEWKGPPRGDGDERQIQDEPTLLDVAFLREGTRLAAGVCRLLVTTAEGRHAHGTAFRIGERRVLTNHHVLFDRATGAASTAVEAWFGYERSFDGADLTPRVVPGVAASIRGGHDHDWAVVDLAAPPGDVPVIPLDGGGRLRPGDRVYIIQHPFGGPKQIGMIHNEVRFVDEDVVQYWTDTAPGSSGSPVFDERWRLVALHHRYVTHQLGDVAEYRNQGRRIERVVEAMAVADRVGG